VIVEPVAGDLAGVDEPASTNGTDRKSVRAANRIPGSLGSIRVRLTVIYSSVLFGLAALMVGAIYFGLDRSLSGESIYEQVTIVGQAPNGDLEFQKAYMTTVAQAVEHAANEHVVELLREYSFAALLALFVSSLGIGWVVAGRVLQPIGRITSVARDIQATDLSRRISLKGPDDELKELADTFDDMLGRIDDAFEEQREFIHEASHELRNPLAVIRTNLDVTLADPVASPEELRQTMQVVLRSTERMATLVDDLLVYARRGTTSPVTQRIDVAEIVQEAAEEFRAPAEARGVTLESRAHGPLWVQGDRNALRRAMANLLANATRLAPAGTTIRVTGGREEPWIWMAVQDEGPGIDPENQERVFQRFWKGDARAGREEGRSGLGLAIVRQIAEAHSGEVRLVSAPGLGAAFAIWLPAEPEPAPVSTETNGRTSTKTSTRPIRQPVASPPTAAGGRPADETQPIPGPTARP
jgi:signal transduction histidine kinase